MRVSTQQTYTSMTQSFNNLSSDLTHVVTQMATGKSIILPSDDPIAATRITQLNRQQSAISQYQDNIDTASAGLSQQESILDGVNNDLLSVRGEPRAGYPVPDDLDGGGAELPGRRRSLCLRRHRERPAADCRRG